MVKTSLQIAVMREAGKRLWRVMSALEKEVKPGVSGKELDKIAGQLIKEEGASPAFLGYKPNGARRAYPAVTCISLNDVVVHGVPDSTRIKNGDLVKIDSGLVYKGWYVDSAITVPVGKIPAVVQNLIRCTEEALRDAIRVAKVGNTLGDIGSAVQSKAESYGFSIVKSLTGHGIGRNLHEEPWVYNVGTPGKGEPLFPGMVIAIEPMIAIGKGDVRQNADDSFVTRDGSLAAHFEHTIAITAEGPEILTGRE